MFTIPNGPDAATEDQSEPDAVDFQALAARGSGVISGCEVEALETPGMAVVVSSGTIVVDGVPVAVPGGSVTIQSSDATVRFDLIVADADGQVLALRGTPDSNPVFPEVDWDIYTFLGSVLVGASTTSITNTAITPKQVMMEASLRRLYDNDDDVVLQAGRPSGQFTVTATGKHTWVDSVLERVGEASMELTSKLLIKAGDAAASLLTLKARAVNPSTQKVLDVQSSTGDTIASISGSGVVQGSNLRVGDGPPNSVVVADRGTLYVDRQAPRNAALWIKEGDSGTSTGWVAFAAFDPSDNSMPVGALIAFLGPASACPPGYVVPQGQAISTTDDNTKDLADLIGGRWGAGAGTVFLPDLRGRIPIGSNGEPAISLGDIAGSSTVTLSVGNLPPHDHTVIDPGHRHPVEGRVTLSTPLGALKATSNGDSTFGFMEGSLDPQSQATTGITVASTGQGAAVDVTPPVMGVTWIVKSRSTGPGGGGSDAFVFLDEGDPLPEGLPVDRVVIIRGD